MNYTKPYKSFSDQVQLLKSRNLIINDDKKAEFFLREVNYSKLQEYFNFFDYPNPSNDYRGAKFEKVLELYYFDKKLRFLLLDMIEKIEISVKTKMAHEIGRNDTFGHTSPGNFQKNYTQSKGSYPSKHSDFIKKIRKKQYESTNPLFVNYRSTYTSSRDVPIWLGVELFTFGNMSICYEKLISPYQGKISSYYDVSNKNLKSWLRNLNLLRNYCAHNNRVWNRKFNPLSQKKTWKTIPHNWEKLSGMLYMMKYLVDIINPKYDFRPIKREIKKFISKKGNQRYLKQMGFRQKKDLDFLTT